MCSDPTRTVNANGLNADALSFLHMFHVDGITRSTLSCLYTMR